VVLVIALLLVISLVLAVLPAGPENVKRQTVLASSRATFRVWLCANKKNLVFLALDEVWAIEAANRLSFVHTPFGRFELDLSLNAIEATSSISLARVHRNWLVNLKHVRELERIDGGTVLYVGPGVGGSGQGIRAPISRERAQQIRENLLATATGIRRSLPGRGPL